MKDLNLKHYSNFGAGLEQARADLSQVQTLCFANPFDAELSEKEKTLLSNFLHLSMAEEEFKKHSG